MAPEELRNDIDRALFHFVINPASFNFPNVRYGSMLLRNSLWGAATKY
jgi:hypothetical protein